MNSINARGTFLWWVITAYLKSSASKWNIIDHAIILMCGIINLYNLCHWQLAVLQLGFVCQNDSQFVYVLISLQCV